MSDDVVKFWSEFEAETGEKVESRTMGTYYEAGGDERGVWGLLVLTDASFRFKHLPSDTWISSLFKSHRTTSSPARTIEIVAPRSDIFLVEEAPRGFLARLFGPAFPRFSVAWKIPEGERKETFAADPSSDFLRRLRAL